MKQKTIEVRRQKAAERVAEGKKSKYQLRKEKALLNRKNSKND